MIFKFFSYLFENTSKNSRFYLKVLTIYYFCVKIKSLNNERKYTTNRIKKRIEHEEIINQGSSQRYYKP